MNNLKAYKIKAQTTSKIIRNEIKERGNCPLNEMDGIAVADMLDYGSYAPDIIDEALQDLRKKNMELEKYKKQLKLYEKEGIMNEKLKNKIDTMSKELEKYKAKPIIDETIGGFDSRISMRDSFLELKRAYLKNN